MAGRIPHRRRICFVTGTRAEYGLMRATLRAMDCHPGLELQIVATGMHLDRRHGRSLDSIVADGWPVAETVPWKRDDGNLTRQGRATGQAIARLCETFDRLRPDVVLVVGDRVEAFAAATAAHLTRRFLAHIHGGDRAAGEIDDSLRHAITKLAHVHFPATKQSAERLLKLGEEPFRIHRVGSPGIDGIAAHAARRSKLAQLFPAAETRRFALLLLHPVDHRGNVEARRARMTIEAIRAAGVDQIVAIYPNNDPGSHQIIDVWERQRGRFLALLNDAPRDVFLGLLRHCAMLIGNSSSGIIEAGSFGTPVINIGDRQQGRERGKNVVDVAYDEAAIARAIRSIWRNGKPVRFKKRNIYGGGATGARIAQCLATLELDQERWLRKLIAY